MILLSIFTILASSNTYDFITSEIPQLYTFSCNEGVTFRYMPLESLKLVIRSSQVITCKRSSLTDFEVTDIDLGLSGSDDYFESKEIELEVEPANITCQCVKAEGNCAISPVSVQDVTSSTGIVVMLVLSIVLICVDICIIIFQFFTFHHRKSD